MPRKKSVVDCRRMAQIFRSAAKKVNALQEKRNQIYKDTLKKCGVEDTDPFFDYIYNEYGDLNKIITDHFRYHGEHPKAMHRTLYI